MKYLLLALAIAQPVNAQSAKDYFFQLVNSGALNTKMAQYACFDDDASEPNFFSLSRIVPDKEQLTHDAVPIRKALQDGFIQVKAYDHGVGLGEPEILLYDRGSYLDDSRQLDKSDLVQIRYTVEWTTMRFKHEVKIVDPSGAIKTQDFRYGHCERLPAP